MRAGDRENVILYVDLYAFLVQARELDGDRVGCRIVAIRSPFTPGVWCWTSSGLDPKPGLGLTGFNPRSHVRCHLVQEHAKEPTMAYKTILVHCDGGTATTAMDEDR